MLQKRIEEASLNAWPALQQLLFDGWIVRFSRGYTKRANSVNPLFESSIDVDEKIEICERLYEEKGLPAIFRLTSFALPPNLDQVLERRHYKRIDRTLVQHLDLRRGDVSLELLGDLRSEPLDTWLDIFCRLSSSPVERQQTHKEILQAVPSRRLLTSLADSGRVVACGLGVLESDYFGLFDLVTDPQQRNKGYGAKLVAGMLRWAKENGAAHAYLQVVSNNTPARHLYAKLGFQEVYLYWYRVPHA